MTPGIWHSTAAAASTDPELQNAMRGVAHRIILESRHDGGIERQAFGDEADPELIVSADFRCWQRIAQPCPPVGWHSFTAAMRQSGFEVRADPLAVAQCLHAMERLFELLRGQREEHGAATVDRSSIVGRYVSLDVTGDSLTVYCESSGQAGRPHLVMLHTAGADARQYHALMADAGLRAQWQMHAFDMPGHGRSPPPAGIWDRYRLAKARYLAICAALLKTLPTAPIALMGCSMGAAMALHAGRELPGLVDGVIALEAPFRASGRRTPMLTHAQVNQSAHNPAYVRGLMSPTSGLADRRNAAWLYSQGGFGIYTGDLAFYSDEFDAELDVRGLDGRSRPIALLTGSYDYSATPDDSRRVAGLVPGAWFEEMPDLGHFPMIENPSALLSYLRPILSRVADQISAAAS